MVLALFLLQYIINESDTTESTILRLMVWDKCSLSFLLQNEFMSEINPRVVISTVYDDMVQFNNNNNNNNKNNNK